MLSAVIIDIQLPDTTYTQFHWYMSFIRVFVMCLTMFTLLIIHDLTVR